MKSLTLQFEHSASNLIILSNIFSSDVFKRQGQLHVSSHLAINWITTITFVAAFIQDSLAMNFPAVWYVELQAMAFKLHVIALLL